MHLDFGTKTHVARNYRRISQGKIRPVILGTNHYDVSLAGNLRKRTLKEAEKQQEQELFKRLPLDKATVERSSAGGFEKDWLELINHIHK